MLAPFRTLGASAILFGAALGFACGGDDDASEEDIAAIRAAIVSHQEAEASGDPDAYLATATDDFIENTFGPMGITADLVREAPEMFLGGAPTFDAATADIDIDGGTATATGPSASRSGPAVTWMKLTLEKQDDDTWLVDQLQPADAEDEPENAKSISMELVDYGFDFDEDEFETGRPIVMEVRNTGEKPHFILMISAPAGLDIEQALTSPEPPEGIEEIGDSYLFMPGQEGDFVIQQPLEDGRYVLLCFIQEPPNDFENGKPHTELGMIADFTID